MTGYMNAVLRKQMYPALCRTGNLLLARSWKGVLALHLGWILAVCAGLSAMNFSFGGSIVSGVYCRLVRCVQSTLQRCFQYWHGRQVGCLLVYVHTGFACMFRLLAESARLLAACAL